MKWGQIILLWMAGLWTVLVSLLVMIVSVLSGGITSQSLLWLVVASVPVWIICGLIWATIYGRSSRGSTPKLNTDRTMRDNESQQENSVVPLREVADMAKAVLDHETESVIGFVRLPDNWVDIVNAHISVDELEKLASAKATFDEIQRLTFKIVDNLRTADSSVNETLKYVLNRFFVDAESSGIKDAKKLVFNEITRRTYILIELEKMIEKASFFKGDARMFRLDNFLHAFQWAYHPCTSDQALRHSLDYETQERIEHHFGKLNRYVLSDLGYLPFAKVTEAGSLSNIIDPTAKAPLTLRIERALPIVMGVLSIAYLIYLSMRPWSEWGQLPTLHELFRSIPFLADEWKITGWTWIIFFGLGILALGAWEEYGEKWVAKYEKWLPECCWYCGQHYKTREAADQCCLSSPPTSWWTWNHKLMTRQDLWKHGSIVLVALVAFFTIPQNFSLFLLLGCVFGGSFGIFSFVIYKVYKRQEPCSRCDFRASCITAAGDVLCTRCNAQRENAERRTEKVTLSKDFFDKVKELFG